MPLELCQGAETEGQGGQMTPGIYLGVKHGILTSQIFWKEISISEDGRSN